MIRGAFDVGLSPKAVPPLKVSSLSLVVCKYFRTRRVAREWVRPYQVQWYNHTKGFYHFRMSVYTTLKQGMRRLYARQWYQGSVKGLLQVEMKKHGCDCGPAVMHSIFDCKLTDITFLVQSKFESRSDNPCLEQIGNATEWFDFRMQVSVRIGTKMC